MIDQPKLPKRGDIKEFDPIVGIPDISTRLYGVLCIMLYLMQIFSPKSSWPIRLHALIDSFPAIQKISVADMGFPPGWDNHDFW